MAKKKHSFLVRLVLFPFVLIGAILTFAFWLFKFKPVREFAWKKAKGRIERHFDGGEVKEGKVVGK